MRRFPSSCRCRTILAWLLFASACAVVHAQDEITAEPRSEGVAASGEKESVSGTPANLDDAVPIDAEKPVPVKPSGTGPAGREEDMSSRRAILKPVELVPPLPPDVPASFISFLQVEGEVVEDRARLTVDVRISLTRPGLWEEVPLRLAEARVVSATYDGTGQHGPVVTPDRGEGLLWKFRGQGDHLLRLLVEVPVTRSPVGSSLALSLPRLHKSFSSQAKLKLPGASLDVEATALDTTTEVVDDTTVVIARMRGGADAANRSVLELRWRPTSSIAPGSIVSVESDIAFRVDPEQQVEQLRVDQTIIAVDQSMTSFRMRVPKLFDLAEDALFVRGDRYVEHRSSFDADGNTILTVSLTEAPANEVRLQWDFRRKLGDGNERLVIDGLDVLDAVSQRGRFVCVATPGYRTSIDWDDSEGIRQVATDEATEVAAASIRQFPFAAVLRVRKERPSITVAPSTSIVATEQATKLRSTFRIDVDRGLVDELTGEWASPEVAVWDDLQLLAPADATMSTSSDGFVIQLRSPRDAGFSVTLAGTADGVPKTDLVGVPRLLAQNEAPTTLRVYAADAVSVELDSASETVLSPLDTPVLEPTPIEAEGCRLVEQVRVVGEPASIRLNATVREAVATASTVLDIRTNKQGKGSGSSVEYAQQINIDIEYGRISELQLELPIQAESRAELEALAGEYRFRVNGRPVFSDRVKLNRDNYLSITVPEPVSRCVLAIETVSNPIPPGIATISLPILRLVGVPFESLTCRVTRNQLLSARPIDNEGLGWVESPVSAVGAKTWIAIEPPMELDQVDLSITSEIDASEAVMGITSLRTRVSVTGFGHLVETRVAFRQTNGAVIVALPSGARSRRFTWNGASVLDTVAANQNSNAVAYETFEVPIVGAERGVLEITYRVEDVIPGWLSTHFVPLPAFPSEQVWRDEDVLVAVDVPQERFLLRSPGNLVPGYVWQRTGLFWQRVSPAGFGQTPSPEPLRHYLFTSPELPKAIEFRTLRGTALIFVAGMAAFAFAFVLYRNSAARSVPRLLAMAVGLVVCGLLEPEVLRLLLQPILLGTCFAFVAVAIDHLRGRSVGKAPLLTVMAEHEYSNWSESELNPSEVRDFATDVGTPESHSGNV